MEEENLMKRSDHGVAVMKKEKKFDSSGDEEEAAGRRDEVATKVREKRPYPEKDNMKPSSPGKRDLSSSKQISVKIYTQRFSTGPGSIASSSNGKEQDDKLESAKAEMGEVREENKRLKKYLYQIMMDYQNLQMQFHDIVQQDAKKSAATTNNDHHQEVVEEHELVSLTLGRFSSDPKMDDDKKKTSSQGKEDDEERGKEGLSLGLDYKLEASKSDLDNEDLPNPSPTNSTQEPKEEETWSPSKVLKTMRSEDEALQLNPVKKTRVCVRARCDAPTMNDGCQWRKYGQKISKGNSCPRAYYRCTVAPSCPVRKQVQRCADDMSILITTYEGNHNHPLPISATAMASTTSAAASMLLSGSSLSASQPGSSSNVQSTANIMHATLHGLNFYLSDNNSKSKFYLPNSTSLAAASSHPTITLDLTLTPSSSLSFPFNRFSSVYSTTTARYPSASLNFDSSESNAMSWRNGLLNYGSSTQPFMKNQIGGMENSIYYQSFMQKNNLNLPHQHHLPDTIAATTKAITADPNFQSALATALRSMIGNAGNNGGASATEPFPVTSRHSQTVKGNDCVSTFFSNKSPSTNSQPGSLIFLPPSLPFSTPKNTASTSPDDSRSHSN